MSTVTVDICGRRYDVVCQDGEEARLLRLGSMIDDKARQAQAMTKGLSESRLLLFAALLLADEMETAQSATSADPATGASAITSADFSRLATTVEKLAARAESLADKLAGPDIQQVTSQPLA